jgi:glucan phosphoethanolaminetransferase (alkaline phosphatase superfamily)
VEKPFLVTFLATYLFIFNEWLFAITKPSFLNSLSFPQQVQIFLSTSALFTSLCFLGLLSLVILGLLPSLKRYSNTLIQLGAWLPAVIFSVMVLLLMDNFTYTIFNFGIVSSDGWNRGLYSLGFLLIILLGFRLTIKLLKSLSQQTRIWGFPTNWIFFLLTSVLLLSLSNLASPREIKGSPLSSLTTEGPENYPHILLITSDGVNANHMSIYGYERDTTPRMNHIVDSALFAENAFTNSNKTTGSVTSIYTGKYPTKTRVVSPPDILKGRDSYEHLPGILRSLGYKTIQIALPFYLDANDINILDGFDEVKTKSALHTNHLNTISKFLPLDKALFTDEILKRVADRIRHIFFIWKMTNPYLEVTGRAEPLFDIERWEVLKAEMYSLKRPVFAHIHLLGTHGYSFYPKEQKFSAGQSIENQEPWSIDFYDDSILEFDQNIGKLVDTITNRGILDKTILIIGSDHGQNGDPLARLPLIIRFPNGEFADRIQANVQNLDIAPTILDYLGIDQPAWMGGESLISGDLDHRAIISANLIKGENSNNNQTVNWEELPAPFYQFGDITLIFCQKWFKLDLTHLLRQTGNIEGSTAVCPPGVEITEDQAFQWIVAHLKENGFDVSNLDLLSPRID